MTFSAAVAGEGPGYMQHSSAVMGLVPMTALKCGLNSSPSNTDAMCNLPQFANSLGKCTVLPCYCNGLTFYSGKLCLALLLWSWCHGWEGGASKIFRFGYFGGRCILQPTLLKVTLEPPQCFRMRAGW